MLGNEDEWEKSLFINPILIVIIQRKTKFLYKVLRIELHVIYQREDWFSSIGDDAYSK